MDVFLSGPRHILYVWMAAVSFVLFLTMGADKRRAIQGRRRVPEARLFLLALLGGAAGGWLGMYTFRHKTKHRKFIIGFPLIAVVQLGLCVYLAIR